MRLWLKVLLVSLILALLCQEVVTKAKAKEPVKPKGSAKSKKVVEP